MPKLAIISGSGALSEQVRSDLLAREVEYKDYYIKPFLPLLSSKALRGMYRSNIMAKNSTGLPPFHFENIISELSSAGIEELYFCGDFPKSQYIAAMINKSSFRRLWALSDSKFREIFESTDENLADPVRYYISLSILLSEMKIRALFAKDILRSLVLESGDAAEIKAPESVISGIPGWLVSLGRQIDLTSVRRLRLSQAAIVDNGIIVQVETNGTDGLIESYSSMKIRKYAPVLFKPPSVDFNPALDQPTIGPITVDKCVKAGITGIVICEGVTIIVDKERTIGAINRAGMFLYSIPLIQLSSVYRENFDCTWA